MVNFLVTRIPSIVAVLGAVTALFFILSISKKPATIPGPEQKLVEFSVELDRPGGGIEPYTESSATTEKQNGRGP